MSTLREALEDALKGQSMSRREANKLALGVAQDSIFHSDHRDPLIATISTAVREIQVPEDFMLTVTKQTSDDDLNKIITDYYTAKGFTVEGDANSWQEHMKLLVDGKLHAHVTATNMSWCVDKNPRLGEGYINITVMRA